MIGEAYGFPSSKHERRPLVVSPDDSSVYTVAYKISRAGTYKIVIVLTDPDPAKIDGFTGEIADAKPFLVTVKPAVAAPTRTRFTSPTLKSRFCLQGLEAQQQQSSDDSKDKEKDQDKDPCPPALSEKSDPAWYHAKGKTIVVQREVEAGSTANFTLYIFDIHDNPRKAGGDLVVSELRALAGDSINAELVVVPCNVTDNVDGSYSIQFNAKRAYEYDVVLKLNSKDVRDPPFKAMVVAAERDPAQCTTQGAGVVGGQHAKTLAFSIVVKDRYGNQIDKPSNDTFTLVMVGSVDKKGNDISMVAISPRIVNEGKASSPTYGLYTVTYAAPNLIYPKASEGRPKGFPFGPWTYSLVALVPGEEQSPILNQELTAAAFSSTWKVEGEGAKVAFKSTAGRTSTLEVVGGEKDGGFGHIWQTFATAPGQRYRIRCEVWMTKAIATKMKDDRDCMAASYLQDNTACNKQGAEASAGCGCWGNAGLDIIDALACSGEYGGQNSSSKCLIQHSESAFVTPTKAQLVALELGNWVPVQLTFVAPSTLTTLRLHFNKEGAYFDRVVMDTHIKGSPFKITTTSSYENSVARGTDGRKGTSASGAGLSGSTAGKEAEFSIIPRDPLGLRQDPTVKGWIVDYFLVEIKGCGTEKGCGKQNPSSPQQNGKEDRSFVKYKLTTTGLYVLDIKLDTPGADQKGQHIEGSPFELSIVSSSAVPVNTKPSGARQK